LCLEYCLSTLKNAANSNRFMRDESNIEAH
jgi:hypothetical protein